MAQRRITIAPGSFYHLYNRGVDKQTIFKDNADYVRFMELLYVSNTTQRINIRDLHTAYDHVFDFDRQSTVVAIGAYCLMPNHFHLLVTPLIEYGVEIFMRKLATGFSMYFNKRYERSGVLFQGRYKSQYVHDDVYLKYLFSYIHLNPLKLIDREWKERGLKDIDGAKEYLHAYPFSSFQDFVGQGREFSKILDRDSFPEYFPNSSTFYKELNDWTYDADTLLGPS